MRCPRPPLPLTISTNKSPLQPRLGRLEAAHTAAFPGHDKMILAIEADDQASLMTWKANERRHERLVHSRVDESRRRHSGR